MAGRPPPRRDDYDYDDYYAPPPRRGPDQDFRRPPSHDRELDSTRVRVRDRDRDVSRGPPAFLRDDARRPPEHGPMVLRKKEVETIDRHRSPSTGPLRRRGRSPSRGPPPETEHLRERFEERVRVRSPSEVRSRDPRPPPFAARRPRSLSPLPPRSPPEREERVRTRIVRRDEERFSSSPSSSPSPSPPPPPQVVRGPTMEREVITHYTDIDHGMIQAHPQPPPPRPQPAPRPRQRRAPPREEEETDIDISLGRNHTEVDVHRVTRSKSRGRHVHYHDDELGDDRPLRARPRAYSDDRPRYDHHHRHHHFHDDDDEGRAITERIDSRGRMGEAWGGATKDWEIVDVPPGTERVRMDGKGGGSTDTTWTKYGGVRRTKFIPERDAPRPERSPAPPALPPAPSRSRETVDVSVDDRVVDIDIRTSTHTSEREPELRATTNQVTTRKDETWTEITKELVTRDAIEQLGYPYEEAPAHFYIMQYLGQNEVQRLMDLTQRIRKARWDDHHHHHRQRDRDRKTGHQHYHYHDDTEVSYHRHRHHHEYPLTPYVPPPPAPPPTARRTHRSGHGHSHSTWEWDTETLREYGHGRQSAGARGPVEGWYRTGY